jgi:DNA gyrase/topoisomerase IV subunit B
MNIRYAYPEFTSAIKYSLLNPEIGEAVVTLTRRMMEEFAEQHPEDMRRIAEKCLANRERRLHRQHGD